MTSKKSERTRRELEKFKERMDRRSVSQVTEEFFEGFLSPPIADKKPKPQENSVPEIEAASATHTPPGRDERAESKAQPQPSGQARGPAPAVKRSPDVAVHTSKNVAVKPSTFENVAVKPSTFENVAVHTKHVAVHKRKDRHKLGRYKLTIRLNLDMANKIKQFCLETNLDIQDFIELAAVHYIENVAVHKIAVDGHKNKMWPSYDDMMINTTDDDIIRESAKVDGHISTSDVMIPWSTDDDIIMLYQNYTGNRWKPADDRVGKELHETDRRIIEIGILQTLLNAKGRKIHSFAYFMPEIQVLMEVNLQRETLDAFLQRRRQQWQAVLEQKSSQVKGKNSKSN